uniref:Sulfotransferase domain-containing protein n=1 Tax=Arion vulgaris TaxID=1028688 RepID=A0A0B6ZEC0_9EUPU
MSTELMEDEFGATMELFRCPNGRLVAPDLVPDVVYNMTKLSLRDDDIMLCSYSKSGCHWLWEVLRYLKFGGMNNLENVDKEAYMVEYNTFERLEQLKSPRILNNHGFFEDQPSDLLKKNVKVVFVYRNIKDLAVSYYHHHTRFQEYKYNDSFTHYIRRLVSGLVDNGSVFEYLQGWEEGIRTSPGLSVHIVSYEDMKENPVAELRRLSEYLGTSTDIQFLENVAKATDFEAMQTRKVTSTLFLDQEGKPIMYRKGQVGDWKNYFTIADSEWMDEVIDRELGHSKLFKFKYSLN